VALLGLEAIDRQDQRIDRAVRLPEPIGILLSSGQHRLVAADVLLDGVVGQRDLVSVEQLAPDLGDRPMAREAALADPAEDVPAEDPVGQGDGGLNLGALGPEMTRASGIGAVVELAD
jgi:hypothetical protein